MIVTRHTLRTATRFATIAVVLGVCACQRKYSTVQGKEMRAALSDLADAEDIYYATNLRYSADQSLIVSLTLPRDVALSIDSADEHGWHASSTHKYGIETCYEWGRNDGSATLAIVGGPDCKPLQVSDTLRDVRSGKMVAIPPPRDRSVGTLADAPAPAGLVSSRVADPASPVEIGSVLLPAVEPAEDFGYPTQTVDRLAVRRLLLSKSYDVLDRVLAAFADSVLRDYRIEYRLFDAYAAFGIAVPSMEPYLTEWVKQRPNSAAAHLARASFFKASAWNARGYRYARETKQEQFVRMGNFIRLALVDLDAALRLEPKSIAAYRQLIEIASFNGDTRASRSFLDKALKLQPNSFVVRMAHMHNLEPRWGGSYEEMGQFATESAPYANRNPRIAALKGYVDLDLGRAAEAAGRNGDAIEAYQRALQYGNLWEFRYQRGRYNSRANQEEAALDDFNSVLVQYPQYADALNDRSTSAYEIGRQASGSAEAEYYSQAFRDVMLAAALDPADDDIQESVAFYRKNIPRYEPPAQ
jgi:tetratricopeptide (TPR) repeat protein